jgi:TatD DNase family protein
MDVIDTHAHLDEDAFTTDRPETVARAQAAGLVRVITIGTTAESSQTAVELCQEFPLLRACVGIQPNYVAQAGPDDWQTIEQLAGQPGVVAVGETGLDRYWDYAPLELQADYFHRHIELSRRTGLPFVVHCREAETEIVAQLREESKSGLLKGVMHSFTGSLETAAACVELGMYISFAGMLTFKKNKELRSVAAEIPADRLLVETDAPYLAPTPNRGKRNEPAYVVHTLKCLADVRGEPVEAVAELTTRNARLLFGL